VTDFGIAKAAGGDDLTRTGTVVGTARYLAPEQVNGSPVDSRADVYALGLLLYEMLTGKPPFAGDTDMATAVARLTNAPEPVGAGRPEISRELEDVVARSLARDPEYRYQSAQAFKEALTPGADTAPTGPIEAPTAPHRPVPRRQARPEPPPKGPPPTRVAPRPQPPRPAPAARRARRWPWLLLILLFLVLGGVAAFAFSNLTSDDSGNGTDTPAPNTGALRIVEAKDFDPPPGGGSEHSDEVQNAIDGDAGTTWQTESYTNRNFGNAKPGVGLWVKLDAPREITSVTVTTLENGWSGQIYVADQPGDSLVAWGQARATGDDLPATYPFELNGASGEYVLVWCTRLPAPNKLQISDIKVEGR
jgi:serine/threonine protein kinase